MIKSFKTLKNEELKQIHTSFVSIKLGEEAIANPIKHLNSAKPEEYAKVEHLK